MAANLPSHGPGEGFEFGDLTTRMPHWTASSPLQSGRPSRLPPRLRQSRRPENFILYGCLCPSGLGLQHWNLCVQDQKADPDFVQVRCMHQL